MPKNDAAFLRGFAAAIATLARDGWPRQAADIAKSNGVTFEDLVEAGVEEFDLAPLREEMSRPRAVVQ